MTITTIEELAEANLPVDILQDINNRIANWLASGGSVDDPYIKQQFRYANGFVNRRKSMHNYAGIEEKRDTYMKCDKKDKCQLSDRCAYLCDNIIPCTYIHYYENKIEQIKLNN